MLVGVLVGVRVGVIVSVTEGVTVDVCVRVGSGVVVVATWAAVGLALGVGELQAGSRRRMASTIKIMDTRFVGEDFGWRFKFTPYKMRRFRCVDGLIIQIEGSLNNTLLSILTMSH